MPCGHEQLAIFERVPPGVGVEVACVVDDCGRRQSLDPRAIWRQVREERGERMKVCNRRFVTEAIERLARRRWQEGTATPC